MLKYKETYEEFDEDVEVFECENCGREHQTRVGGDIACCPCESENW